MKGVPDDQWTRNCTPPESAGDGRSEVRHLETLFELEGLGGEYLMGQDPDEYVRELRAGWE
jgi:hypothetical protein